MSYQGSHGNMHGPPETMTGKDAIQRAIDRFYSDLVRYTEELEGHRRGIETCERFITDTNRILNALNRRHRSHPEEPTPSNRVSTKEREAMTWPPAGTKALTQVFCLPGSKTGTLSIFPQDCASASVVLDLAAAKATRDALNEAIRRMEAS